MARSGLISATLMPERRECTPQGRGCWRPAGLRLGLWLGVAGASLMPAQTAPLKVVGSDLLGPEVVAVWEQRATEFEQALQIDLAGSRPALDRLQVGTADLALLLDYPDAPSLPEDWMAVPLGYVPALILAPMGLETEQVALDDLAEVFGATSAKANLRWGDLGARGDSEVVPVAPSLVQAADGLAEPLFRQLVLGGGAYKGNVQTPGALESVLAAAAREEGALVIAPRLPEAWRDRFKVLMVASGGDQVAFGPSPDNLRAGDYPLSLTLRLAFPRSRAAELLDWLRLAHGESMAEALAASGVVPLSAATRAQQVFDLELIR